MNIIVTVDGGLSEICMNVALTHGIVQCGVEWSTQNQVIIYKYEEMKEYFLLIFTTQF